ncbi:hypothetical protein ACQY0O_001820 [Thecaphora frezii]
MITLLPLSVPYAASNDASVRTTLRRPSDTVHQHDEVEQPKALAYLLQIDDIRVLIDCGSPEDFSFAPAPSTPTTASAHDASNPDPNSAADDQPESSAMAQGRAEGQQQQKQQQQRHEDLDRIASGPLDRILATLAPTIDLVLLSHSSLAHLGLYAYAYAHLGLRCLAYATMPVQSMGKLTVLEAIETWRSEVDIDREATLLAAAAGLGDRRCIPTADQVEEAFDHVKTVRYLQPTHLEGKCTGLTLTAYNAGHALGGAIWKLRSPTSGTVLIALDWNHNRERHLDGTALLASSGAAARSVAGGAASSGGISDAVRRPDLLITEIQRGVVVNVRRKDRDAALLDLVHRTIQGGHSVLFPVDASARLLELLVLLDQHWAYAYPHARFPLCFVSRTGKEVLERSRTYMEWMTREWATKTGEAVADEAGGANANDGGRGKPTSQNHRKGKGLKSQVPSSPLDFKFLKVFGSIAAMDEAVPPDQAKVVLAVPPSMTHGPSRRLFARFAERPNDLVVLLQRGEPGSLSRHLWDAWNNKQDGGFRWTNGKLGSTVSPQVAVEFELNSKVPLEGDELRAHLEAEQAEKDRQAQQRALLARSRRRLEADEQDDSDSSDDDESGSEDEGGSGAVVPGGKVAGGGFAEPGSMGRKRNHAVAFEEGGGRRGGGSGAGLNGMQDDAMGANGDMASQVSFDIYLKGNASRATSFFGSKPGQEGPFGVGVRYRLFPVVERKRRIDGFGETIDVARWLSRRKQIEATAAEEGSGNSGDGGAAGDDEKSGKRRRTGEAGGRTQAPAPPSKFVTETVRVEVACRLAFIEMEGLNDGRALKTLIPQMHPRRLIAVNGDAATRQDMLSTFAAIKSMTNEIYLPALCESVRIGELTNSYAVVLGDSLLAGLTMSRFEDYEVAHITAAIRFAAESTIPTLEAAGEGADQSAETRANGSNADPSGGQQTSAEALVASIRQKMATTRFAAPRGATVAQVSTVASASASSSAAASGAAAAAVVGATRLGPTLFVGDLKLSTLKSALSGSTYRLASEFAGEGMLVCGAQNGSQAVTVKKEGQGRIVIEGNVGRAVRNVRKAVYELHAAVGGR